jgi:hypothetical protein
MKDLIKPIGSFEGKEEPITSKDGVIYKLKCKACEAKDVVSNYIGETGRLLRTRLDEHFRMIRDRVEFDSKMGNLSQIQKHMFLAHPEISSVDNWEIEILGKEKNTQHRKVIEALEIQKHKPTLNIDKGVSVIF